MTTDPPDPAEVWKRLGEIYAAAFTPKPRPAKRSTSFAEPSIFDPPVPKTGTRHKHWKDQ